jgi:soluble epoxide hydrolase/lipid-phosphate phosphatase
VLALALLSIPYRTLELGLPHLLTLVNRDIYPASTHPSAQWAYMAAYVSAPDAALAAYEAADLEKWVRARYTRHDPAQHGAQANTSATLRDGWRFDALPDVPLSATALDEQLYAALLTSRRRHGFGPPTAYYLNHGANAAYAATEINGGVLGVPVLFVDARHDAVCSVSTTPLMGAGQRAAVPDLTVAQVEAEHWLMLEAPGAVNEALEGWLRGKVEHKDG